MRNGPDRTTLTVIRHLEGWAIEIDGEFFDHARDKEEVKAAANKRARAALDAGRPCQVRVSGEHGFFAAA